MRHTAIAKGLEGPARVCGCEVCRDNRGPGPISEEVGSMADLWQYDEPVAELGITVPDWIEQDITPADVAAILQGGCSSGAYMPAVTYHQARETMNEHGDDVLEFLESMEGILPQIDDSESWSGIAVHFLSAGVELWASAVEEEISDALDLEEEVKPRQCPAGTCMPENPCVHPDPA